MILTFDQVARLALEFWDYDAAIEAVATAYAESEFDTRAISPTGCCYGLWQINLKAHDFSKADAFDPRKNAARAKQIWTRAGNTFERDWTAHGNAKYRRALPRARIAVARVAPDVLRDDPLKQIFKDSPANRIGVGPSQLTDKAARGANAAKDAVVDVVSDKAASVMKAVAPVLLSSAMAATALALIGYGLVKLVSSSTSEHVKQAIGTAGAVGKAVS